MRLPESHSDDIPVQFVVACHGTTDGYFNRSF